MFLLSILLIKQNKYVYLQNKQLFLKFQCQLAYELFFDKTTFTGSANNTKIITCSLLYTYSKPFHTSC